MKVEFPVFANVVRPPSQSTKQLSHNMESLRQKGLAMALVFLGLDQLSKYLLLIWLADKGGLIKLTSFLNIVTVWNRGISFGFFQSGEIGRWLLVSFSSLVCLGLGIWLWRQTRPWPVLALAMVIGGALGNIIDRILRGAVADFFDFQVMGYHWPAFNLADSAITIGVGMLLYDSFRPLGVASNDGTGQDQSEDV